MSMYRLFTGRRQAYYIVVHDGRSIVNSNRALSKNDHILYFSRYKMPKRTIDTISSWNRSGSRSIYRETSFLPPHNLPSLIIGAVFISRLIASSSSSKSTNWTTSLPSLELAIVLGHQHITTGRYMWSCRRKTAPCNNNGPITEQRCSSWGDKERDAIAKMRLISYFHQEGAPHRFFNSWWWWWRFVERSTSSSSSTDARVSSIHLATRKVLQHLLVAAVSYPVTQQYNESMWSGFYSLLFHFIQNRFASLPAIPNIEIGATVSTVVSTNSHLSWSRDASEVVDIFNGREAGLISLRPFRFPVSPIH